MWVVATSTDFDRWFAELGEEEQEEIAAKVELLEMLGPSLPRPHADTLKGSRHANMKELRGKTSRSVLRVAFAFDPNRRAILLIGGDKSGVSQSRFYKALIDRADQIYERHLQNLRSKGNG